MVSHYDADGISAAGILCQALSREGYPFHATLMRNPFNRGFDRLLKENNDLIIFSDMGSGQIETLEQFDASIIILDHHQYMKKKTPKNILQINANLCGLDGNYEACGATMSYGVASALNAANEDLVVLALAGAIGDKQHIGGMKGLNKTLLDQALSKEYLQERVGIKLSGKTVQESLYYSIDPYYANISGKEKEIEQLLDRLSIDKTSNPIDIEQQNMMKLQSYLFFKLITKGCQPLILDTVIRPRYHSSLLGCELERFADLLDACGKNGYRSLGLSLCFSDTAAWEEAEQVEKDYKDQVLKALIALEEGGLKETPGMRYFSSESSSLGGVIAGIAANFLFDEKKPLLSIAKKDHELHISCRGNQELVSKGLDLGGAMKKVSSELGGYGGGHKIAAGATIDEEKEQEFLEKTDALLSAQLKG